MHLRDWPSSERPREKLLARGAGELTRGHTLAVTALVTDWHGQGAIDLPGCRAARTGDRIVFSAR